MRKVASLLVPALVGVLLVGIAPNATASAAPSSASATTSGSSATPESSALRVRGGHERTVDTALARALTAPEAHHYSSKSVKNTAATVATEGENPPGRVTQAEDTGGYVFGYDNPETLTTTVTVPTMDCSNLNVPPGPSWSTDLDKSMAIPYLENGPVEVELYYSCPDGVGTGEYYLWSTLDPNCKQSGGFGSECPQESAPNGAIVPGDQVQLTVTTSTTATSDSITDLTSGASLAWTGPGLSATGPVASMGVADYCFIPGGGGLGAEPCNEDSPDAPAPPADFFPYGQFQFNNSEVDGTGIGTALTNSTLNIWNQDNSVYGSTLLDQTSYVGSGNSFTVTYSDTLLPSLSLAAPAPIDQPTTGQPVNMAFTFTLSFASTEPVYADYATTCGSQSDCAVAGTDYTPVNGVLDIPAGKTTATVDVPVLAAPENPSSSSEVIVGLNFSGPSYAVGGGTQYGTIVKGPIVLSVDPQNIPLTGLTQITVTGLHFGTGPDTVMFCDEPGYGVSDCEAGTDVVVDSDTQLTVVTPDGTPMQPANYTQFGADTIVTDADGVSSPINEPGDVVNYGCTQVTAGDGDYTFAGCVIPEGSTDVSEQGSNVDGLDVTGASKSDPVDYAIGSSSVGSAGPVGVSLSLKGKLISILKGEFDRQLSQPITFTIPPNTQLAGFTISGTLTLTPDGSQAATGSVTVTLPGVLGGGTGTLTFVTTLNTGLSDIALQVPKADFMQMFSLTNLKASYSIPKSTWSLSATASTGPSQSTKFAGSLTYSGNTLSAGSLNVDKISLAGLLEISKLTVTYSSTKGWSGGATITESSDHGTVSASISLTLDSNGNLTAGTFDVGKVNLYNVLDLNSFDMTYAANTWTLSVAASLPNGGSGSGSASMAVSNGIIANATLTLNDVSILDKITIKTASISYSTSGGDETWTGNWDVDLPQAAASAVNNINGSLTFVNGSFTQGQIGIGANVPLIEGVFLTALNAQLTLATSTTPMTIGGDATISFGPKVNGTTLASLTGGITRTFAGGTSSGVYTYSGNLSVLGTTLANGTVVVPDTGPTVMTLSAGAQGSNGLVIPVSVGGVSVGNVSVVGGLNGTFTASSFTLKGNVAVTIPGISTPFTAGLVANGTGMAACAGASGAKYGFQYDWGGNPTYEDTKGCTEKGF